MTTADRRITLIGAGLVGGLLATLLAQRDFKVQVFERRSDPRRAGYEGGRSINLALAERGRHALRVAGLQSVIDPITVMMRGRMIHDIDGNCLPLQRYGRDDSEVIWSVSRGALNIAVIDAAEKAGAIIHFDQRLDRVDWDGMRLHVTDDQTGESREVEATCLIGSDGAGSALRKAMSEVADLGERFEPLDHGYKELEIPALADFPAGTLPANLEAAAARGERYAMEPNALHIWPRGNYMCIALPNSDGSFTVTLFLPNEGDHSFATLTSADDAMTFFQRDFGDAVPLIPDLADDFASNPVGMLGTLYLDRWNIDGRALLVGDASHAIVPFHGQGMNSGFEDAVELADLLAASPDDIGGVFDEFSRRRKPNADAIAEMALDNYIEMRDRVDDADFLLMRELDRTLSDAVPSHWMTHYAMVTFSRMPYSVALERTRMGEALLRELTAGKASLDEIDLA
ncbi:MAG: NAD(P)/FAD-dependent oxidoreductase, partial [Dokdonella sp.]